MNKHQGQNASLATDIIETNFQKSWIFLYNSALINLSLAANGPLQVRW